MRTILFSFIIVPPASDICVNQHFSFESEIVVALQTDLYIANRRNTDWSVFVHNVYKHSAFSYFTCSDTLDGKVQFLLVVEGRKTFIAIKGFFVIRSNFPYGNGDRTAEFLFYCKIRTRLASLEKQFIALFDVPIIRAVGQRIRI